MSNPADSLPQPVPEYRDIAGQMVTMPQVVELLAALLEEVQALRADVRAIATSPLPVEVHPARRG